MAWFMLNLFLAAMKHAVKIYGLLLASGSAESTSQVAEANNGMILSLAAFSDDIVSLCRDSDDDQLGSLSCEILVSLR